MEEDWRRSEWLRLRLSAGPAAFFASNGEARADGPKTDCAEPEAAMLPDDSLLDSPAGAGSSSAVPIDDAAADGPDPYEEAEAFYKAYEEWERSDWAHRLSPEPASPAVATDVSVTPLPPAPAHAPAPPSADECANGGVAPGATSDAALTLSAAQAGGTPAPQSASARRPT